MMINRDYRRYYIISLGVLLVLSAYPLISGVRMAFLSIINGAIEPAEYAKYVVPYAAMCFAVILFAAFQPLLFKMLRFAFPAGLAGAYGVFFALELFFERIKIRTAGMSLIDPASLTAGGSTVIQSAEVDIWQASLCIASPLTRGQADIYASQDGYLYVMANKTYKIHYYLISLILIAMICGLVYGIGRMLRSRDRSNVKPLMLRSISTAALTAMCVFANTTAFFRQTEAIQTPLASFLTCLFFVGSGTAIGVYAGSFLLKRGRRLGVALPAFLSLAAVTLLYIGEAVMMEGGLYRFGTGWFFGGLPVIALAPVDILVILLSGAASWLILRAARAKEGWPEKKAAVVSLTVCALVAAAGIGISAAPPSRAAFSGQSDAGGDIFGCYAYVDCLYMNPLSSFMPFGNLPYVYGVGRDSLVIANTQNGDIFKLSALYEKTPVAEDDIMTKAWIAPELIPLPDLSLYKERWLRAVFSGAGREYVLYQMDGEIWLADMHGDLMWSIYRLKKTDKTTLSDLERALAAQEDSKGLPQLTLKDVYAQARKGEALTLSDFDRFDGKAVGSGFTILRYEIEGGCVLTVHSDTPDSKPNYIRLSKLGYDPYDENLTVDIRQGTGAVAAYLDPLYSLEKLKIEDPHGGSLPRELIYEFDGYRYYLNTTRADSIFITFDNGDRLPLKVALEERRTVIEDLVANGLYNVSMTPVDNPLGGEFPTLHHRHAFTFDGETFYPSASFMYVVYEDGFDTYFDIIELADTLSLQGRDELADTLRRSIDTNNLTVIAGKPYITEAGLSEAGIAVVIGWTLSSHTPVDFNSQAS